MRFIAVLPSLGLASLPSYGNGTLKWQTAAQR